MRAMASAEGNEVRRSGTLLLLAANAVLAGFAWYASTLTIATEPVASAGAGVVAERAALPAGPALTIPVPPDAARLNSTRERPLFRADRRPYEAKPGPAQTATAATAPSLSPPAPSPAPTVLPSDLRLVGIVAATGQRRAVFRKGDQRDSISVVAGDRIGDWRIAEIRTESVVLVAGPQREILELFPTAKKLGTAVRQ